MSAGSNYLDPNRPEAVRLSVSDARALGEAALARIRYGEDNARIITDQLIDNSLPVRRAAAHLRNRSRGEDQERPRPRLCRTRNTRLRLVDGGNNVGYVAVYRGAEIAIAKAKQSGVAAVGVYNSYFSGRNA